MDFLALIPEPSGRLEHLPADLLNLILQTTAESPEEKERREQANEDDGLPPYQPHHPQLVSNFVKGSRRLAKVYIDFHIRKLESFQAFKRNNIPLSLIFETPGDVKFAGLPPGFYWRIINVNELGHRYISSIIIAIHNYGMPSYACVNKEKNSSPDYVRRRNMSMLRDLDFEVKGYLRGLSNKEKVVIDCII